MYCQITIFTATLRASSQQVLEKANVVFSAMSLQGWSTCYMFQLLSWVPHSVLKPEHRARKTKVVREAPQCNEKTHRTSLTSNFFRQSYGPRFLKRPETRDHINSTGGNSQKTWVSILVLHIDPEPFFFTLLFWVFFFTFPCFKEPINGQIWWNLLQYVDSISDESIFSWLLAKD